MTHHLPRTTNRPQRNAQQLLSTTCQPSPITYHQPNTTNQTPLIARHPQPTIRHPLRTMQQHPTAQSPIPNPRSHRQVNILARAPDAKLKPRNGGAYVKTCGAWLSGPHGCLEPCVRTCNMMPCAAMPAKYKLMDMLRTQARMARNSYGDDGAAGSSSNMIL